MPQQFLQYQKKQIAVKEGIPIRIGRHSFGSEIEIECDRVSRKHATVEMWDGKMYVIDTDSTAGVLLNGQQIAVSEWIPLKNGDTINISDEQIDVIITEAYHAPTPTVYVEPIPTNRTIRTKPPSGINIPEITQPEPPIKHTRKRYLNISAILLVISLFLPSYTDSDTDSPYNGWQCVLLSTYLFLEIIPDSTEEKETSKDTQPEAIVVIFSAGYVVTNSLYLIILSTYLIKKRVVGWLGLTLTTLMFIHVAGWYCFNLVNYNNENIKIGYFGWLSAYTFLLYYFIDSKRRERQVSGLLNP